MTISRRTILKGAGALPLLSGDFGMAAFAQARSAAATRGLEVPPILFVHGNGDHAALWITTLGGWNPTGFRASACSRSILPIRWRGPTTPSRSRTGPRPKTSAANSARPSQELKRRTGAARVALVGNSRGGNSIRSYIKNGGAADVSHAVLCGVPNHGVFDWDDGLGNRVQRPRSVPARAERGRQRSDAGHRVPDAAQRRHGQIRASRRPLRRQAGHADRRHLGRPGAEGRDQSRARRDRPSRDRVFIRARSARSTNSSRAANRSGSRSCRKRKSS